MLPTVRAVLEMPAVATAEPQVLAGADQLDRPVRWLHPAEVGDIAHLLRGDELVLTTGVILARDDAGIRAYAESLAEAGVAGIIVELGRRWHDVPAALTEACGACELVLIALHREVSFAKVVEEVGARIHESEVADLRLREQIHQEFTRLDVEAAGPEEILAAVVRIASVPVVLESYRRQVIGYDTAGRPADAVIADWAHRSKSVVSSAQTSYDRRAGWLTTGVGSPGDDWGRLILITDDVPSSRDYVLVERAAAALALHQMRARARDSVERNAHTVLLAELRAGRVTSELAMRCEAIRLPIRARQFVGIGLAQRHEQSDERPWSLPELSAALAGAGRAAHIPMLVGEDADHVLALMSLPQGGSVDTALATLSRELGKQVAVTLARGEVVEQLDAVFRTLVDARHVLAAAPPNTGEPWVTLADVHLRGLLQLLADDERVAVYVRRELGPLLAREHDRGCSLVEVLQVYLGTPGGKSAAAKRLHLSRPVLYERLAKIEAILGVDLEDPHVRTSLHVAVLARSMMGDEVKGSSRQTDKS